MSRFRDPKDRSPAYVSGALTQILEDLLIELWHAHDRGEIRGSAVARVYSQTDADMRELLGDAAFMDRTRVPKLGEVL